MQRITQRNKFDCSIAALAMVTGLSYEKVLSAFPFDPSDVIPEGGGKVHYGVSSDEVMQFLYATGHLFIYLNSKDMALAHISKEDRTLRCRWNESPVVTASSIKAVIQEAPYDAIVSVDSWANTASPTHHIVWDGKNKRVLDPSPHVPDDQELRTYQTYEAFILYQGAYPINRLREFLRYTFNVPVTR